LLLFLEFLLDLAHLLSNTVVWTHGKALSQQLDTKDEEENGSSQVCETLRQEGRYGVTKHSGEHSHDSEGGEGGGEDDKAGVSHGHESSYEEGLVANLGEDDHCEGEHEGVEGLDNAGGLVVGHGRGGCLGLWGGVEGV
jgi:hypothetical protein